MITEGQRHAHEVRQRLMNGKPPVKPIAAPEPIEEVALEEQVSTNLAWQQGVKDILLSHDSTLAQVISYKRNKSWSTARSEIAHYLRSRRWSLKRIGGFLKRDHSAMVYILDPEEKKDAKRARARERAAGYAPARAAKAAWGNRPVLPIIDCRSVAVFGIDGWALSQRGEGNPAPGKGEEA